MSPEACSDSPTATRSASRPSSRRLPEIIESYGPDGPARPARPADLAGHRRYPDGARGRRRHVGRAGEGCADGGILRTAGPGPLPVVARFAREQPRTGDDLPQRLPRDGRGQVVAGRDRDRLEGLRREHAGHTDRAARRAQRRRSGRRGSVAGRDDARTPDRARGQRADHVRGAVGAGRRRADDLPGALRERCESQRTIYRSEWIGTLSDRAGQAAEDWIARGWDDCLHVLDLLDLL